jgi:antitoxin (DNA-binding transcriptional repressor) of toxin-antitoxin stability system
MAIVTMRQLLRDPGEAFGQVDAGEACLVTRNGKPVAALVPVDEADAEKFLLASLNEFAENRREAEHAHSEGRTTALDEVAERFGISNLKADEEDEDEVDELVEQAAAQAQAALATSSDSRFPYFPSDQNRFVTLNDRLLRTFADVAPTQVAAETGAESGEEGLIGLAFEQVVEFNKDAVDIGREVGAERTSIYEAFVLGGIGAIERLQHLQGIEHSHGTPLVDRVLHWRKDR